MEEEEFVHTSVICVHFFFVGEHYMHTYLFTSITVGKCQCICMHGCMHICTSVHVHVHISVRKHDLMQHGIPNTSGALSIFFFGKDFLLYRAVPSIHDIYEAPMSPSACCPDN